MKYRIETDGTKFKVMYFYGNEWLYHRVSKPNEVGLITQTLFDSLTEAKNALMNLHSKLDYRWYTVAEGDLKKEDTVKQGVNKLNMDKLKEQLVLHEGLRLKPYRCTAGKLTIGVGRNIDDKGITDEEAMFLLDQDIAECVEDVKKIFDNFDELSDIRQRVLIDMRFNLGGGSLRQFKTMIKAVNARDFEAVAKSMVNSKWYKQVGNRSKTLVNMMINNF